MTPIDNLVWGVYWAPIKNSVRSVEHGCYCQLCLQRCTWLLLTVVSGELSWLLLTIVSEALYCVPFENCV